MNTPIERPRFTPADDGVDEARWLNFFDEQEEWAPTTKRLVVVAPHPDDEVLGAGGLMSAWSSRGDPVLVVSVTDGEAADRGRDNLAAVRRVELLAALGALSTGDIDVERLGIPDGRVNRHRKPLTSALAALLDSSTTLIAPYAWDGHPDHEAVGRACCEVAERHGAAVAQYPIWLWHHTPPAALPNLTWGKFPLSPGAQLAKAKAMRCSTSQNAPEQGEPILPAQVLAHFHRSFEAFVL